MDALTPETAVSLSERAKALSARSVVAALYQEDDLGSAILVQDDGTFVDALEYAWVNDAWTVLPEGTIDYTFAAGSGEWPSKANGGTIRARVAGGDVSIPVGRDGHWTFIARVPDIRDPGNTLELLEDPE